MALGGLFYVPNVYSVMYAIVVPSQVVYPPVSSYSSPRTRKPIAG